MVKVEAKRVVASRSDSTRVLSDKSEVDSFAKNLFQALDFDVSCHVEF